MEKTDHVALTLSNVTTASELEFPRRSLRRTWNQLPRLQRNLILLGICAMCATVFLFLTGDQFVAEENNALLQQSRQSGQHETGAISEEQKDSSVEAERLTQKQHHADNAILDEMQKRKLMHQRVFKKPNIEPVPMQNNIENVVNLPETQNAEKKVPKQDQVDAYEDKDDREFVGIARKVDIRDFDDKNNNIEAPAAAAPAVAPQVDDKELEEVSTASNKEDYHEVLKAAVLDPFRLPGRNGLSIEEFASLLDKSQTDMHKQHFHGPTNVRQTAVVSAFKHSWTGYKTYAWGHDNLKPVSQNPFDWFGLGLTIVDSLDTMYIMGLEDEFLDARNWVRDSLSFEVARDVNLFETTIRVLGGLLSAYHLSGDKVFLMKSIELGNRLLPSFLSPSGIPFSDVNLSALSAHSPKWSPDSSTSEVTTIQLEFRDLSRTVNVSIYEKVSHIVNEKVHALEKNDGLVPIFINANTGTFRSFSTISLGARGDSYYEYLLKQWLQTGRKENDFLIDDYIKAIDGVQTKLMRRTPKKQYVYIGELINGKTFKPKMDHLTCYLPGTLLLGYHNGMPATHLTLANDLLFTCYQTYMEMPTQLAAEISYFGDSKLDDADITVHPNDAHNLLRPEFIESLYYFYALTGNRTYQDWGWNIFQAFEKHTKVASGYTSIGNVKNVDNTRLRDMMESFWLGETLKYFYLLFSDNRNEIDLNKWVFNTEAHLIPIRNH